MKKGALLTVGVTLLVVAAFPASAGAKSGLPKATGDGTQITGDGSAIRTFSFTAITQADGTVTGEAHVENPVISSTRAFELDCIDIIPGNNGAPIAISSGVVTSAEDQALVGRPAIFAAQDNGEQSGSALDRMTLGFRVLVTPIACTGFPTEDSLRTVFPLGLFDITTGNIQVKS